MRADEASDACDELGRQEFSLPEVRPRRGWNEAGSVGFELVGLKQRTRVFKRKEIAVDLKLVRPGV